VRATTATTYGGNYVVARGGVIKSVAKEKITQYDQ